MKQKSDDLAKVSTLTIIGFSIFIFGLFWLKGYKLYNNQKITVYFEDVSGLEEGAIVRWSGVRVGVVEKIVPALTVKKSSPTNNQNNLLLISKKELAEADKLKAKSVSLTTKEQESLLKEINHLTDNAKIYYQQGLALQHQEEKEKKSHVKVTIVIMEKDVPFGPLSSISIVPTGFVGEHYMEITPIIYRKSSQIKFSPVFITEEPLRFERFLRANVESSEAFKEAIAKLNKLIKDEDLLLLVETVKDVKKVVNNVNKLADNANVLLTSTSEKLEQLANSSNQLSKSVVEVGENINEIIGDNQVKQDLKTTTSSLNTISTQVAKLLNEKGLSKDILDISKNAKDSSTELSAFIKELRATQQELELPRTISNLNSLSDKLDKLTSEVNDIVADKKFKEDLKVTAQKARETSENLEKVSKKFSKRFLLFRLLF